MVKDLNYVVNNNNESVEPDEQSKDKDKEKEAGKVNDDLVCEEVTKDLHWKDMKLFPPEKNRSNVWKSEVLEKMTKETW